MWDLKGIPLLTTRPALAQKDNQMKCHVEAQANLPVAVHWRTSASEDNFGFQSVGLRSFLKVWSAERSVPFSPMRDAQDHQDMREGEEDLFGGEDFEGSEEAK